MRGKDGAGVTAAICGVLAVLSACSADTAVDPAIGVEVTVDSAVYHLQQFAGGYEINVKSTIANHRDHDIFIARDCFDGRHLRRADPADKRQLLLGEYECIESQPVQPIRVSAGAEFTETWRVTGSNSPQTRPPITIDDNTGSLVMTYLLTDSSGGRTTSIASKAFNVEPPISVNR